MDTYTPDPTNNPAAIRYVEDGDAPTEANFFATTKDLADKIANTQDAPGDHAVSATPLFDLSKWQIFGAGRIDSLAGNAGGVVNEHVLWGLGDLPQGVSITQVSVSINPSNGGNHGAFPGGKPAQMPSVSLIKVLHSTGAATTVETGTDSSSTQAAYEAQHTITHTLATPEVVDRALYSYFIRFQQEGGANSNDTGMQVLSARVTWERL